ncbi:MAG: SusD/RagB family nutrient-binding outer membrane lipoprotein [Chitinophagaceae bacterium]|nr:MAG: SusD/RagB family nutrient-binding outer membrane lipoprotein [Chitinophagaceae bacterium]
MKRILFSAIISMLLISCNKFLDVNENPNAPTSETLPLRAKLPAVLVSTVNQEQGQLNQIGSLWGGYWGTTNEGISMFVDLKTFNGPAIRHQRDGIPVWENGFNTLLYYQLMKEEAESEGALFYAGIAKIMQGWHFFRLVDIYNNVPFDDALRGTQFPTPRYEEGRVVYQKAMDLVTAGISDIKNSTPGTEPTTDDILFAGNRNAWYRFANTVKLRALIRQSEVADQSYVNAEIAKIQAEGTGFIGAGQTAQVQPGYLNTSGKLNPFWESYYRNVQGVVTGNYQDIRPTSFIIDQYKLLADPRIDRMYVSVAGDYRGVLFGNPDVAPEYSRVNTSAFKGPSENGGQAAGIFKSATQASILLSSFESLFLQAEATERGWISGNAKALFESGIEESFSYLGVPGGSATYAAQPLVSLDNAADPITRIIEQKWLALNSISGIEAWNDFRRLGVPAIPNSLEAPTAASRPLRFMYPETERMTNNENASLQGSDDVISAKVWWDL